MGNILITGMGVVSAAGVGVAESVASMAAGERNVGPVSVFDSPIDLPVFEVKSLPPRTEPGKMRTLDLLEMAVDEAMAQAGLGSLEGLRVGVAMGTTVACQLNDLGFYSTFRAKRSAAMDSVDGFLEGNLAEATARRLGAIGPKLVVANACSSGTDSIGAALSWLKAGLCDIAFAGGSDEMNRIPLCGFNALGVASDKPCMPFDGNRTGLNLGEGAGVLILETAESAARRGAEANLRVCGYGSYADAYHLTAPHPEGEGLVRAIEMALGQAGISKDEIAFVNAHGTSTPDNDKVEGRTLLKLFGAGIKVLSTKGYTGHTLGGAGGIEAVFSAAGLAEGWIPGSAGFETVDEEIGLVPTTGKTEITGNYALSTSLAFGGNNAALVLGRDDS
ncbi:3-oxoacyl-[acyl-carrier-protein] synthase 2 [Pontiella desulfatans]|uniref:3-oxoacyl-[acyl-carrier-protein] synthase 2 n=1 Tax=Pontiella desulfatans TaxID=2750659 RepID=A0A6C2TWJ6_PONDE|nr:beta-ketoacyl-[acyl-carrier-protein] synthase family protein [Pontiella desulfatans]VGO12055.1 3-oxoacyl-[acyl-carrier-protein] synthase 2 [Pontiella desulfatans]